LTIDQQTGLCYSYLRLLFTDQITSSRSGDRASGVRSAKTRQRSTINEVAERAGVAKTTVSHAISGKRPVAAETRQRIFAAMRELQFTPNPIAQRLAGSHSSRTVGLVLPLASSTLGDVEVRFITSIAEVINKHNFTLLTLSSPRVGAEDLRQILLSGLVDGLVLMRIQVNDDRVRLLKETNIPFVMIGRTHDNNGLTFVDLDGEAASGLAISYLAELGHQYIAFICPEDLNFGFAYRLVKGFEKACRKHHLPLITTPAMSSDDAGYQAMKQLLIDRPELTAVVVWSDVVAVGAISALRDASRDIPGDMSLISFDRSEHLPMALSDLTIIDTRPEVIGVQAAEMLLDLLNEAPLAKTQILMPPRLINGKSTARCTKAAALTA
jgi:DNA-binding LacI/PurR family transcriptional regulator